MLEILDTALIAPIRWALLLVLDLGHRATGSHGVALLVLSVVFNVLLMPAYLLAERVQAKERAVRLRMQAKIDEFVQAFKGQERHWMLRQLYRLHGYHPALALRSLAPLAIQVPFFIAAYGLLSHHAPLQGQAFLLLPDLGRADGLLAGVHLLPLLMTAVNLYALGLYTRQSSRAEWAQGVVVALIFLVLLYQSPSGLVLYWAFNNALSAARIAWVSRKQPRPAGQRSHLHALLAEVAASCGAGFSQRLTSGFGASLKSSYVLTCAALFMLLALAIPIALTSLEDNVDGLGGYVGFFLWLSVAAAVAFAVVCAAWYALVGPVLRAWTVLVGLWLALAALACINPTQACWTTLSSSNPAPCSRQR
jgi:membrane protein insertase Oxa1/YidC/SpoIIIJ